MVRVLHDLQTRENIILTKALKNAAEYWEITNKQLAAVIGLSEATISRLKNGQYCLEPDSKPWQLAVLFLRLFRGLDAYMGGHIENEKRWLRAHNTALGAAPVDLIGSVEGLASAVHYVDCMRGQ